MILRNPIDSDLTIKHKGEWTIKALSTLEVPEDVGIFWKERIHQFLIVEKTANKKAEKEIDEIKEIVNEEPVSDVEVADQQEEVKPKGRVKKTK